MEGPRFLSGEQLVAQGITKIEATLPEIGLKEVAKNGSWLEEKQIQSALEARKHLVEVQRIEKSGSLSHAVWKDDIGLAEVVQKAGGYWQYLGFNVGKITYLRPEEALFLIEINSLLLQHNEVTVSLQKAYSLLLKYIPISQYKVYASLSRLGYRLLKHKEPEHNVDMAEHKEPGQFEHSLVEDKDNESLEHDTEMNEPKHEILEQDSENGDCPMKDTNEIKTELNNIMVNNINQENSQTTDVRNVKHEQLDIQSLNVPTEVNGEASNINGIKNNLDDTMEIDNNANETVVNGNGESDEVGNNIVPVEDTRNVGYMNNVNQVIYSVDENGVIRISQKATIEMEYAAETSDIETIDIEDTGDDVTIDNDHCDTSFAYQMKLQKLLDRKYNTCYKSDLKHNLNTIPDFYKKQIVTVNVPEEKYLPRNVFLNNTAYVLNLDTVKKKVSKESSRRSSECTSNDGNVRQIRSSMESQPCSYATRNFQGVPQFPNQHFIPPRFPSYQPCFRPYLFLRPRYNYNTFYPYNVFHQRPVRHFVFHPRYRYQPHPYTNQYRNTHFNANNAQSSYNNASTSNDDAQSNRRKRYNPHIKAYHLQNIKDLARRFKNLPPHAQVDVNALIRLVNTYNTQYKENLIMTPKYNIVTNTDVIELDDEEETRQKKSRLNDDEEGGKRKKPRLNDDKPLQSNHDEEAKNLNELKTLASKLKNLEVRNLATSRHRRVFSNAIKTFNKSFNADVYLNPNYEIIDRKLINLDSSSDSDIVITVDEKPKKRKKLRNPFNILKRLSGNLNREGASTSQDISVNNKTDVSPKNDSTNEYLLKYFNKAWVPNDNDFGRAEVCSKTQARLIDVTEDQYLYEYLKEHSDDFENWLGLKISFTRHVAESIAIQKEQAEALNNDYLMETGSQLQPIIGPADCTDMPSVLKKLQIISTCREVPSDTRLRIHFDVYNRDVQNFRKSNLPKPHFRIICLEYHYLNNNKASGEDGITSELLKAGGTPVLKSPSEAFQFRLVRGQNAKSMEQKRGGSLFQESSTKSNFPPGAEIAALHSKYQDKVAIIFAVVGVGSISYLQINPIELPVYVPQQDLA